MEGFFNNLIKIEMKKLPIIVFVALTLFAGWCTYLTFNYQYYENNNTYYASLCVATLIFFFTECVAGLITGVVKAELDL
jgi:hypothetical protein